MRRVLAASLACLTLGLAAWTPPRREGFEQELDRIVAADLLPALLQIADWCNTKKLYATRNEVYELVLEFEPDHALAREQLKYSRDTSGQWVQSRPPNVKNRNEPAEDELVTIRPTLLTGFRRSVLGLMVAHGLSPFSQQGQDLLDVVLRADPDDATVRGILRQVKLEDLWVLEETYLARERRLALAGYAKAALDEASTLLKEGRLLPFEETLGVPWYGVAETPGARVVGLVDQQELRRTAQAIHASGEFFCAVFDRRTRPWDDATIYLLPDTTYRDHFIDGYPGIPAEERDRLRQLAATGIPGTAHAATWETEALRRLDASVRHTLSVFLRSEFQIKPDNGWVWEGFGLYLGWRVIGTRLTWYGMSAEAEGSASAELRARLLQPEADWRTEAITLLRGADAPVLADLLDEQLYDLDARDMLLAYSLASYLIESQRGDLADILTRIGKGESDRDVLEGALGMELPLVSRRVLRWLEEEEPARQLDPGQVVAIFGGRPEPAAGKRAKAKAAAPAVPWVVLEPARERALLVALEKLGGTEREALLQRCLAAARATGARQVALVDAWVAKAPFEVRALPSESRLPAHDASYFKGGPPRKVIGPGNKNWDAFRAWLPPERAEPWTRTVRYELATGRIVALPVDPSDTTMPFRNLLAGVLPGHDLAEALVLERLDSKAALRKEAFYFGHLYCDREARAYEGITLLDAWSAEIEVEVPDPDAQAYARLVWGSDPLPVPLGDPEKELWYPRIAASMRKLRDTSRSTNALAAAWLAGRPSLQHGYHRSLDTLHALIALGKEDPEILAARIERDGPNLLQAALAEIQALGDAGWNAGNARRDELAAGEARIRKAVIDLLESEGFLR